MNKPQIFLLHFAGGNCYSFQFMAPLLNDFEVIALELPGRGKRINENLLNKFEAAAQDIYDQLTKRLTSSPFIIYGHSMGAYLGFKVCRLLEQVGKFPVHLVVSGNAGPRAKEKRNRYLLEHNAFIDMLDELGGIPPELLKDKELFSFFEPILRADFEIAEINELENEPPVNTPLYAMIGSEEEEVNEVQNWARFTRSRFDYEIMEGDHFFIHKHAQRIARIFKECYRSAARLQQQ